VGEVPILLKVPVYCCDLYQDELGSLLLVNADHFTVGVHCHRPNLQSFAIDIVYLADKHIHFNYNSIFKL